jgi:hypothetical protein
VVDLLHWNGTIWEKVFHSYASLIHLHAILDGWLGGWDTTRAGYAHSNMALGWPAWLGLQVQRLWGCSVWMLSPGEDGGWTGLVCHIMNGRAFITFFLPDVLNAQIGR